MSDLISGELGAVRRIMVPCTTRATSYQQVQERSLVGKGPYLCDVAPAPHLPSPDKVVQDQPQ